MEIRERPEAPHFACALPTALGQFAAKFLQHQLQIFPTRLFGRGDAQQIPGVERWDQRDAVQRQLFPTHGVDVEGVVFHQCPQRRVPEGTNDFRF